MRILIGIAATLSVAGQGRVDFGRDVGPVLAEVCLRCHGPQLQMGNLRLDSRGAARKVIVEGKAADSKLYQRVAGLGGQPRMPMGGKPLAPEQIERIKNWIDQGAEWPENVAIAQAAKVHWAYVAPRKSPATGNAIDYFVRARLEKEGLKPTQEAARATLLRRLSLDLTGLPPSPAEVDAFVRDPSARAYERQVERLLASPHYGEKWGRWWLDAARYADSDGFEKDKQRQVWFYRDWVIQALNRDLPYNRFVIEQLAGDLLPNPTQDQRVATGFLRNSMINEEGGIDPEQFRMEAMFDRMDAVGKAMLGVTIQCAQCHNHKYDPLSQEEYYRLFAFLNNSYEGSIAVYTPAEQKQRDEIFAKIRAIEKAKPPKAQSPDVEWEILRLEVDDISTGGERYLPQPDGSFLAAGYAPTKHNVKLTVKTQTKNIAAVRLELMNDPDLPFGGPGRSPRGTAALTEFEVFEGEKKLTIARASADLNLPETLLEPMFDDKSGKCRSIGPIDFAIDGDHTTAWGIDAGPVLRNQPRTAVFNLEKPIANPDGTTLIFYLRQDHGGWNSDDNQNHNLGRFRLSLTAATNAAVQPEEIDPRVLSLYRQLPEGTSQLVLHERTTPRETHVLTRGDFLKPGKLVETGTPAFLNPWPEGAPRNRLGLALWLTDRRAPTTARSLVNRVWQAYFGQGLVISSEDLGRQSDAPSHPELLDWLAVEFMENGWSLKHLHRLIVTSATYRQSSVVSKELLEKDPANRLLARGPRVRVEAEAVRDIALSASGLLNAKVGGPSVYPPAPAFLFLPPASYGPKNWWQASGTQQYRRALYTFRYRSVPYPMLQTFDAPNGDMACVRRPRSNTPLQALTTLNEPLFFEAAEALGRRALKEGGATDSQRVAYAFKLCTAREPDAGEKQDLLVFLERQKQRDAAMAWTALSRVLLNLDETITKE